MSSRALQPHRTEARSRSLASRQCHRVHGVLPRRRHAVGCKRTGPPPVFRHRADAVSIADLSMHPCLLLEICCKVPKGAAAILPKHETRTNAAAQSGFPTTTSIVGSGAGRVVPPHILQSLTPGSEELSPLRKRLFFCTQFGTLGTCRLPASVC